MPDLDQLLRPDVSDAAARAVRTSEFAPIAARGRRRRRRNRVVAACGVLVLAGVLGTILPSSHRSAPAPANPHPSPHRTQHHADAKHPTPQQVVDDTRSRVEQVAVSAEDPGTRAAVWTLCSNPRCTHLDAAIAITDARGRRVVRGVRAVPLLTAAGPDAFVVSDFLGHAPYLLRTDGTRTTVGPVQPVRPVRPGEAVVAGRSGKGRFIAINPESGAAHRIATPGGVLELSGDNQAHLQGVVFGADGPAAYVWSENGGDTWSWHQLPSNASSAYTLVPSARPGTTAVLEGADGATLFPFIAVHRGTRDAASWRAFPESQHPIGYVDGAAVLPDGRLIAFIEAWADRKPSARPPGLVVSRAGDWSDLTRLRPTTVGASLGRLTFVGVAATPGHATMYVAGAGADGRQVVYAVDNGGSSWTPVAMR